VSAKSPIASLEVVAKDGELRFAVQAKPRAKRTAILGVRGDDRVLEVALAAPPVDGAANTALVEALSSALALPKSQIRIARGESARRKLVAVSGIQESDLRARLELASGRTV
jgi:uncharacterized protein (TIGR00251 family)